MTFSENVSAILRSFATAKGDRPFHIYREVHAQQVELLFRQLPLMLVTTVLVGLFTVGALLPVADRFWLGAWFSLHCAITLYRFGVWRRFAAGPPAADGIRPHLQAFILGTFLSGSVWGLAGAFLLGEELAYQYFFGLIIAGLAAGGVSALSSHRAAYAALLVPMVLPYALRMALHLDPLHVAIGLLGLVYVAVMLGISHRIHTTIAESLNLRFDNLGLVDTLLETKDHLEEANMMLQKEIMERRQAQEILMKSEQKLRLHAYQAPLAFIEWDLSFRVLEWNPAAEKIFGYTRQEALGRHAKSLIAAVKTCETISVLWPKLLNEKQGTHVTVENRTKGRGLIVCEWYYTPLVDPQGKVLSVITLAQDVTASRQAQERLNYLAYHDELTGLPNRTLFNDRLSQATIEARRQGRNVAVLLLDVDNFKMVNDTMGHDAGDDLLRDIGKRLSVCVRESDTVARFGGDEFGMVLADVGDPRDTIKVAQKILDAFAPPFFVGGRELFIGTSLGITIYPVDADNLEGLIKNADSAMYHAKAQGRNNFQFYSAELTARAHSRFNMETGLRRAVERHEFQLHYQPKYDMRTKTVTGVEALLRWKNSDLGVIPPSEFISLAEESGLILPIGEWVFRTACEQLVKWQEQGLHGINLAVNLSSKQVRHNRLKQTVTAVLAETGLDPHRIEFEITESLLMDGGPEVSAILGELKELGFSIALDDFGTGYSSLSYLKRFPIDTLKIDRSFVRDLPGDQDAVAIVRAIIAMSHSLRMKVIAEGVETEDQKKFLRDEGCDEVQGYLCGRPVPADEIPSERFRRPPPTPVT